MDELGLILGLVTVLILWIYNYSLSLSIKPGVPKGRFWQIPVLGENLKMASAPFEFFLWSHVQRYGRTFRTHLLGGPCICVSSVDTIKFVLQSPLIFKRTVLKAQVELLGGEDLEVDVLETRGAHILRGFTRSTFRMCISELDRRCKATLANWERLETVNIEQVEKFIFSGAAILFCDYLVRDEDTPDGQTTSEKVQGLFGEIRDGLMAIPINIPGTPYHRAVKMRKQLQKKLLSFVTRRRAEKGLVPHHDLLELIVRDGEEVFTDVEAVALLISLFFVGLDTSSSALIWTLIELVRRPELVALLREENDRMAEEMRKRADDTLTYQDLFEKLPYTNQVIQETLRLHNVAPFVVREVGEDVVHEGLFFPKGWKVLITPVALHKDPNNHSNPDTFDPSRFASRNASKLDNYMPFGSGQHYCKGQDYFKIEVLVFLHRLLTGYDFKVAEKFDTVYSGVTPYPTPRPQTVAPFTVSKRMPEPILY